MRNVLRSWASEWKGVVLYGVVAVLLAVSLYTSAKSAGDQARKLEQVATETHPALCTFTDDLTRRYETTRKYLRKHEGREPIPGITRADLRRSLQAQKSTLDALSVLNCGEVTT